MALAPHEQFAEAVKRSRSVAVVLPSQPSIDALGGGLALARFIGSYGKPAEVVSAGFSPSPHLSFMPGVEAVKDGLHAARHTVLSIPMTGELHDLRHEIEGGMLKITITPKNGALEIAKSSATAGQWRHDLIVAVCVREPNELGHLLKEHRLFFEETPVVNIDVHPANENHGTINIMDMRASAASELVATIIETVDPKRLDADTATCLLAGIIGETKSFRTNAVTPRTLETASRLVMRGARRETIIEALFRTRPVETLRLWGRVLARLKADREHKMVWSVLGRADFIQAGADESHLADVIDELVSRASDAEVICLLHEHPTKDGAVRAIVSAERGWNAADLAAKWNPAGTAKRATIEASGTSLPLFEQELIASLRQSVSESRRR
jgi:nanoRNase/pAp phosphatase (c-di-AMP/oligoRNAs hydrolase)